MFIVPVTTCVEQRHRMTAARVAPGMSLVLAYRRAEHLADRPARAAGCPVVQARGGTHANGIGTKRRQSARLASHGVSTAALGPKIRMQPRTTCTLITLSTSVTAA